MPRFLEWIDQIPCIEHRRCTRFSEATKPKSSSSSEMNRYPNVGSSWWASKAASIR